MFAVIFMVKEINKYICEYCGLEDYSEEKIREHEKIPISGLNFKNGQIFKYPQYNEENYLGVAVVYDKEILKNHISLYYIKPYQIPLNNAPEHLCDIVSKNIYNSDLLSELTDNEYELALKLFSKIKHEHPSLNFLKGVISYLN